MDRVMTFLGLGPGRDFVLLALPKTASTSLERTLTPYATEVVSAPPGQKHLPARGFVHTKAHALAEQGQLDADRWTPLLTARAWENFLLPGLWETLRAALLAVALSIAFGLVFGLGRLSQLAPVRFVCTVVVEFFRAVPVLVMMIFFYLGIARLHIVEPADLPLVAVVLGLTFYNGSVFAELIRSGVHSLPRGQREAALAVGLRPTQSLRLIEVPQALIAMLPALDRTFTTYGLDMEIAPVGAAPARAAEVTALARAV